AYEISRDCSSDVCSSDLYPILAGAVGLMALVQVPGIGVAVNGNQNWIAVGGSFQLQPSEFGKLALVLWGADLLARKQERRLLTQDRKSTRLNSSHVQTSY